MLDPIQILQILREIVSYQWVVVFVLLGIHVVLPIKDTDVSANTAALAVVFVLSFLGYKYTGAILQTDPGIALTALQHWLQEHQTAMLFAWYAGLCVFDAMGLGGIYLLHRKYNMANSAMTHTVLYAYFADGMLNLFRLAERYLFDTDYLDAVYQWGIPSINIGALLVLTVLTGKAIYKYRMDKYRLHGGQKAQ